MQNMKSQTRGTRSGSARFEKIFVCQICFRMSNMSNMSTCSPRVRFAGRRSTVAVDMFARGTAVTLILFSSCKERQAVLRSAGLCLC